MRCSVARGTQGTTYLLPTYLGRLAAYLAMWDVTCGATTILIRSQMYAQRRSVLLRWGLLRPRRGVQACTSDGHCSVGGDVGISPKISFASTSLGATTLAAETTVDTSPPPTSITTSPQYNEHPDRGQVADHDLFSRGPSVVADDIEQCFRGYGDYSKKATRRPARRHPRSHHPLAQSQFRLVERPCGRHWGLRRPGQV